MRESAKAEHFLQAADDERSFALAKDYTEFLIDQITDQFQFFVSQLICGESVDKR